MSSGQAPVVIGVDVGTTATKAVAVDASGRTLGTAAHGYPLLEPAPGQAVQDPDAVLAAVIRAVREVVDALDGRPVAGLSFSVAMHSLLGLDPLGDPVTPLVTWADTRASAQADRLRAGTAGAGLYRRTGTPVHPMSPLTKLIWWHENEPKQAEQVGHWGGIKEYVLLRLCDALVVDHSVAAATGMLAMADLNWDPEALRLAGVLPEQLAELVATTHVLPGLVPDVARRLGLPASTPVVVGSSDGPLANLGSGAVRPGVAACSIGTSGALRVMVDRPAVDPLGGVFCYPLTPDRWVVGGAINNGGVVLEWVGDALAPDLVDSLGDAAPSELTRLAGTVPAGSGGLLMLPYLLSERAPHWTSLPRGVYLGLTRGHRREHLVRAALEGVCLQLALVLEAMRAAGIGVHEIRAGGGFARSDLWRQLLADVLDAPIGFPDEREGSGFGAALLGLQALGVIESFDLAADLVTVGSVARPDPAAAAVYRRLLPVFSGLYDALVPAYTQLRRLAPTLPLDAPNP